MESVIRKMPPELSNKIAAGEVIQRPASVVRELLDNAVDAGATEIRIVLESAGKSLIQVTDNGCGMSAQDLRMCIEPHATSKLYTFEDLHRIQTMGFRGEAMPSIASVSKMEIRSKRHEDAFDGYRIEIDGGEEIAFEPAAVEPGTQVTIRNLFFNVPARRQFLRTDLTELRYMIRTVQQTALANPDIAFEFISDGERLYVLPSQSLLERIPLIFGASYKASMIPVQESTEYLSITGFIGDPKHSRKNRGEQFLFVNQRAVQHRVLTHRILSVYEPWLGANEYPFFALFVHIHPSEVDVNVHPAKLEIKFSDERSAIQLVGSVVKKALHQWLNVPVLPLDSDRETSNAYWDQIRDEHQIRTAFEKGFEKPFSQESSDTYSNATSKRAFSGRSVQNDFQSSVFSGNYSQSHADALYQNPTGSAIADRKGSPQSPGNQPGRGTEFWQLHGSYILSQTRSGLCIVDQHAAHKRILYEKALQAAEETLPGTQQLLFSQTIELSATDFVLLREIHADLLRMGFNIQLLSGNTAVISGVPSDIDLGDEKKIVEEILQQYRDLEKTLKMDQRHRVALAFATRSAIPRRKVLRPSEMENLMDQLFACEDPYRDPTGKPTLLNWSLEELISAFSKR